ncbi:MAG: hypothetical protein ACKPJJ_33715, partial [Planctomycetaceae bacterium]
CPLRLCRLRSGGVSPAIPPLRYRVMLQDFAGGGCSGVCLCGRGGDFARRGGGWVAVPGVFA